MARSGSLRAAGNVLRLVRDVAGPEMGVEPVVFDPICGEGTVLAVANRLEMAAVGVEQNRKRAEEARALVVRGDEV